MKRSKLMILIFFLAVIFSCQREKNPVTPPIGGNIHPQVDIPWPSLANSPWPIAHGNMQCTGRSSFKGPQEGKVSWYFTEEHMVDLLCSPVIGEDGTIYFTSNRSLYALNPNGTLKWKFVPGRMINSSPMVGAGNIIYLSTGTAVPGPYGNGCYYAINSDGSVRWEFKTNSEIYNYGEAMGLDGKIYFPDVRGTLYSLNPDGTLNWKTRGAGGFEGGGYSSISMSPDGSTLYIAGLDSTLNAVSAETSDILWQFPLGLLLESAPLVDSEGNIYVFGFKNKKEGYLIYSITPDGKIRWAYHNIEIWNVQLHADMFMDAEGNIYFCKKYELASLDYNGQLRWTAPIDNGFFSPILGDRFGDIYLTGIMKSVYAYNNSGQKIFECAVEPHSQVMIGGAISADGHLYISESTDLYCIR